VGLRSGRKCRPYSGSQGVRMCITYLLFLAPPFPFCATDVLPCRPHVHGVISRKTPVPVDIPCSLFLASLNQFLVLTEFRNAQQLCVKPLPCSFFLHSLTRNSCSDVVAVLRHPKACDGVAVYCRVLCFCSYTSRQLILSHSCTLCGQFATLRNAS
jgi:hypothetical protein